MVTDTSYDPASRLVITNAPLASVTPLAVACVFSFLTVTVAPGRTPFELSTTVPPIWPVNPCADTRAMPPASARASRQSAQIRYRRRRITTVTPPRGATRSRNRQRRPANAALFPRLISRRSNPYYVVVNIFVMRNVRQRRKAAVFGRKSLSTRIGLETAEPVFVSQNRT